MVKEHFVSLMIGIAVGMLTVVGQKFLPDSVNNFANSGAVWLVPAFLISYYRKFPKLDSIVSSMVSLLGCVVGYYAFEPVINRHGFYLNRGMFMWIVMSLVGGTIFGFGGWLANNSEKMWKYLGKNLLSAVFICESVSKFIHFEDYRHLLPSMILSVAIGVILYFAGNGKESLMWKNLLSLVVLILLGSGMYEMLYFISI